MFHPAEHPLERGWVGRIDGEHVTQLAAQTLQSFFTGGGNAREHAVYPLAGVRLLAPVLHPPSVRVFEDQKTFAFANPAAIVGPGTVVAQSRALVRPRVAGVVGAKEEIAGWTLLAEWRRPDLAPPKDRDFALGLGPVVVTAEELDPRVLDVSVRVDGVERMQDALELDWSAARDLAAAGTRLCPGDLLVGPTRGSVEVEPGAAVEIEASDLGVLDQRTAS